MAGVPVVKDCPVTSTILPTWALDSMSVCASAASFRANVRKICGLISPAAIRGQTFASRARQIEAFSATVRGRKVDPESVRRFSIMGNRSMSALEPLRKANRKDAAIPGGGRDVPCDVVAADHVEDDIDAAALGQPSRHADEILGAIVDGALGAQVLAGPALLIAPGGGEHAAAEGPGQHDGGSADAGRPAVDEKTFARPEGAALEHVRPHGHEGFRQGSRLDERKAGRNRHGVGLGDHAILRVTAARHEGGDLIADGEPRCASAPGDDPAGDFEARRRGRPGGRRIAAGALQDIGPVDAGGRDLDENFAGRRLRDGQPDGFEHLGTAGGRDGDGVHEFAAGHCLLEWTQCPGGDRKAMDVEEERKPGKPEIVIGEELGLLSVEELERRIGVLLSEIERFKMALAAKRRSREAANSVFKT